jgi:hypothetical protein
VKTDSIDLQDPDTPSAQDHTHQATTEPSLLGKSLGLHQAETLREVAAETREQRRISWANGDIGDIQQLADEINGAASNMQQEDALAVAQNGGSASADDGDMEVDGDGDLDDDDDMMDKISSSPSIEDGGYTPELPPTWPARVDSLRGHRLPSEYPVPSEPRSSSPYLENPEHLPLPLKLPKRQLSKASAQIIGSRHHPSG